MPIANLEIFVVAALITLDLCSNIHPKHPKEKEPQFNKMNHTRVRVQLSGY